MFFSFAHIASGAGSFVQRICHCLLPYLFYLLKLSAHSARLSIVIKYYLLEKRSPGYGFQQSYFHFLFFTDIPVCIFPDSPQVEERLPSGGEPVILLIWSQRPPSLRGASALFRLRQLPSGYKTWTQKEKRLSERMAGCGNFLQPLMACAV